MVIEANFAIPKSWNKSERLAALAGDAPHIHVPDCDNMAKLYMDCIKGIVFEDDAQVVSLLVVKKYAEEQGVIIHCLLLEQDNAS